LVQLHERGIPYHHMPPILAGLPVSKPCSNTKTKSQKIWRRNFEVKILGFYVLLD
jgi:hypothetical protein